MKKADVLNSKELKQIFLQDNGIPISMTDNPYFMQRLKAVNQLHDSIAKFNLFCDELKAYKDEQEYFTDRQRIVYGMIDYIKEKPEFSEFLRSCTAFQRIDYEDSLALERGTFISIKIVDAYFSAMRHFYPGIFGACETWQQFVNIFTPNIHLTTSRKIYKAVTDVFKMFGTRRLCDKIIGFISEYITSTLKMKPFTISSDEILIRVDKSLNLSLNQLKETVAACPDGIGDILSTDVFYIKRIKGTEGWQKTYYSNHKEEIVNVSSDIYHQVAKYLLEMPISEDDLVFVHNGRNAKFLRAIKNPWKYC